MTSTRTDLSTHVSLLLQQQKRLRELYSELTAQPVSSNAINTNTTRLKTRGELRIAQERFTDVKKHAGYDWIASEIEAAANTKEYTDEEIRELEIFRKSNYSECHNPHVSTFSCDLPMTSGDGVPCTGKLLYKSDQNSSTPFSFENYSLNNRLFAEPTNAYCNGDETQANRYIQISIPHESLQVPYNFRPRRRKSFDSVNSMELSKHCLVGFQRTKYPMMPVHKTIALGSSLASK